MPGAENLPLPVLGRAVGPEDAHLRPVGGKLLRAQVVEFKKVLDEFILLLADGALLAARGGHHAYLLLGVDVLLLVGVYAQEAEHAVRRGRQQRDDGLEHY